MPYDSEVASRIAERPIQEACPTHSYTWLAFYIRQPTRSREAAKGGYAAIRRVLPRENSDRISQYHTNRPPQNLITFQSYYLSISPRCSTADHRDHGLRGDHHVPFPQACARAPQQHIPFRARPPSRPRLHSRRYHRGAWTPEDMQTDLQLRQTSSISAAIASP